MVGLLLLARPVASKRSFGFSFLVLTFFGEDKLTLLAHLRLTTTGKLVLTASALALLMLLLGPRLFGFLGAVSSVRGVMSSAASYVPGSFSVAYVTVPNVDVAKKLARGIVENRLAACVNIVPQVTSIYRWKDKIEEDSELLLIVKTRSSVVEELSKFVRENHPYEVAEVIALPIQGGNPPYLKWLEDSVSSSSTNG